MASSSSAASDWLKQDERRMLHAVYRVGDMDATVKYYTDLFGMKLLRFRDIPDEKCVSGVFLGVEGGGRRDAHSTPPAFLTRPHTHLTKRYSNAFLGYGPEDTHFALELT